MTSWFRKDAAFDAEIRERFGAAIAVALAGGYGEWCATADGALARVLLLDQFTRNVYRDTAAAFAGDARALATAQDAVERGLDRALDPFGRWFLYMPFEHAEDRAAQRAIARALRRARRRKRGSQRRSSGRKSTRTSSRALAAIRIAMRFSAACRRRRKSRFSASPVRVSSWHGRRSAFTA